MASPAYFINQGKDPTSTLMLRKRMIQDVDARFAKLRGAIRKYIITDKMLGGIKEGQEQPLNVYPIGLAAKKYVYGRSDIKLQQFMDWLRTEESKGILEVTRRPLLTRGTSAWSDIYVQSAYQSGLQRSRADLRKEGADIPSFEHIPGGIAGVMNQPFHSDRLALLYSRTFNEMEGITAAMNQQLGRALARGMAEGKGPYQIATDMVGTKNQPGIVDKIGKNRARLIARTEIVNAHNEAALNEYEATELLINEPVLVQWWSALDEVVRPKHDIHTGWHGMVMTREEGQSRLGEPNCRCKLLPWIPSSHGALPANITQAARAKIGIPQWDPAKTLEELDKKFKEIGLGRAVFDKKYSKNVALKLGNEMAEHFSSSFHRFPKLQKIINEEQQLFYVEFVKGGELPGTWGDLKNAGIIGRYTRENFKIELAGSLRKVNKLNIGKGFTISNDFFSTARHEYGHHFFANLIGHSGMPRTEFGKLFKQPGGKEYFSKKVSRYAATNVSEAFAESFSAYTSPLYKKGMLSKELEDFFDNLLKGK